MTVKCCVCTKIRIDNQWLDSEVKSDELVSHSYCPVCLDVALAELTAHGQASGATTMHKHTHQALSA